MIKRVRENVNRRNDYIKQQEDFRKKIEQHTNMQYSEWAKEYFNNLINAGEENA
jgi:DNA-binding MarR family transcriptional regulator